MNNAVSAASRAESTIPADQSQNQTGLSTAQARQAIRSFLEQRLGEGVVSIADLDYLANAITSREYRAGDLIVRQGVRADAMGLVARGQVARCPAEIGPGSPALALARATLLLLPGSAFGEAMMTNGSPSRSTVRAVTDAKVWFLRRADYLSVADNYVARGKSHRDGVPRWLLAAAAVAILLAGAAAGLLLSWPLLEGLASSFATGSETRTEGAVDTPVRIIEPPNGAVAQVGLPLPVRAVVAGAGLVRAELWVDDTIVAARSSPRPIAGPWEVELDWRDVYEGQHSVSLRAEEANGSVLASTPITVTIVPTGYLAFASNREGNYAIYEMRTDGTELKPSNSGREGARQPAWRADGALSWTTTPPEGWASVHVGDARSDKAVQLFPGRNPAWSIEGKLAYDAELDGASQVFASLVPDGVPQQITSEAIYAGQPSWSPDGTRLAYVAMRGGDSDIWVVDVEGGQPVQLTAGPSTDWSPAWSPDGEWLAFVSDQSGTFQIHLMRIDGSDLHAITNFTRGAEEPAWSPGGAWLAIVAYTGAATGVDARELYLISADGNHTVRLTDNQSDDTEPAWSGR